MLVLLLDFDDDATVGLHTLSGITYGVWMRSGITFGFCMLCGITSLVRDVGERGAREPRYLKVGGR